MSKRTWAAWLLLGGVVFVAAPGGAPGQPEKGKGPPRGPDGKGGPGFGPPGGFGGPMGQIRQVVKQFDKDGDGRLNKEERKAAREFLKKGGGGGGFRPGGPGRFGPGTFLSKPLVEAADSDKDGKLTKAELLAGLKKLFAECDR